MSSENVCEIMNECNGSPCNDDGSFECEWAPDHAGTGCNDINECDASLDPPTCDHSCNNSEGSFNCECYTGFVAPADVDECADDAALCEDSADCENNDGSFTSECHTGFEAGASETESCNDIDECFAGGCEDVAICENIVGSFTCSCPDGYVLDSNGTGYDDIDKCTDDSTCDVNADCSNLTGIFECACHEGYDGDGTSGTCIDVDECENPDACPANAQRTNTIDVFEFACMDDSERSLVCNNLDECEIGSHNCHASAVGSDALGSFECACLNGFTGNGTSCVDIDECQQDGFVEAILSVSTSLAVQTASAKTDIPKIPMEIAKMSMSVALATSLLPRIPIARTMKVVTQVTVSPASLQMVTLVRILTSVTLIVTPICRTYAMRAMIAG